MVFTMRHKLICSVTLLLSFFLVCPISADEDKSTIQWFNTAVEYKNKKDYDNAIFAFTRALEKNDPSPDVNQGVYWFRGTTFDEQGKYELAISDFTKAIELGASDMINVFSYNNRGWVYCKIEKFDLAIEDFNKAIEINPRYAVAYNNRGVAYCREGHYALALADYEKCINLSKKGARETEWAYLNRADLYLIKRQYDLAIANADKVIELNPKYAKAYFIKAEALTSQREIQEAIEVLQTFIQRASPEDNNAYLAKIQIVVLSNKL